MRKPEACVDCTEVQTNSFSANPAELRSQVPRGPQKPDVCDATGQESHRKLIL